jgi:hypothetical protein
VLRAGMAAGAGSPVFGPCSPPLPGDRREQYVTPGTLANRGVTPPQHGASLQVSALTRRPEPGHRAPRAGSRNRPGGAPR